ncbi:MAG: hypothetical protein WCA85_16040 [Paraburkholderia sp.]|uniref:hypothetical protein n=1 Tax=Paraburkholderia sp. TaxID=1926495 RepID=UPI003C5B4BFB
MQNEKYGSYVLWGHAILQQEEILQAERYAASATVTRDTKFVEASGTLGAFDSQREAELVGLAWARAWVDSHG